MNIDANSFHAMLYRWTRRNWASFTGRYDDSTDSTTNICLYIRTLFVWLPLMILCNAVTLGMLAVALVMYAVEVIGWPNYFLTIAVMTISVIAILALVRLLVWNSQRLREKREKRSYWKDEYEPKPPSALASFLTVLWQYMVDWHEKVCTNVHIIEEAKPETPTEDATDPVEDDLDESVEPKDDDSSEQTSKES